MLLRLRDEIVKHRFRVFKLFFMMLIVFSITGCDDYISSQEIPLSIEEKADSKDNTTDRKQEMDKSDIIHFDVSDCDTSSLYNADDEEMLNDCILNYYIGGIRISDGSGDDTDNKKRIKTEFIPLGLIVIKWEPSSGLQYLVAFYDEYYNLIDATDFRETSDTIDKKQLPEVKYVRFLIRHQNDDEFLNPSFSLPQGCEIVTDRRKVTISDNPTNVGTMNVIQRAKQCSDLSYVTKNILPGQKSDIDSDTCVTGVMYSSTREESLYVPNAVSFESYLSAIYNPNSYIYTRTSKSSNSRTYYGTVCSAFASYCYNLPCIYTTYQLGSLEDFDRRDNQNIDGIQLGDMVLKENSHVIVIVGIERDINGLVYSITEAEAIPPQVITKKYYRNTFIHKWLDQGYHIYSYSKINLVKNAYSKWTESDAFSLINKNLCTRRGNKTNWMKGETIEIDILDSSDYDKVGLYKEDKLIDVSRLPDDMYIRYDGLECGNYEVRLFNASHKSDPTSFKVVDVNVKVENLGEGNVKISFSSANATPKWYAWCYTEESKLGRELMAVAQAFELSEEDRENGFIISNYEKGEWLFKVEFQTEYGLISSDFISTIIT